MSLTWVNGVRCDALDAADRGLAFGDGVFETMRLVSGRIPLQELHLDRLQHGASVLAIGFDRGAIESELSAFLQRIDEPSDGVIKLMLTRGSAGMGYRGEQFSTPTRILRRLPPRSLDEALYQHGAELRICRTRLGSQPILAGIKHLNRLEQVLARNEWSDDSIFEGLMLDEHGSVIEGVSTNLFIVSGGRLLTPVLDHCGVNGVMRTLILERVAPWLGIPVSETRLVQATIAGAQEVFICNSVIGVVPVSKLGSTQWRKGVITTAVQQRVNEVFVD